MTTPTQTALEQILGDLVKHLDTYNGTVVLNAPPVVAARAALCGSNPCPGGEGQQFMSSQRDQSTCHWCGWAGFSHTLANLGGI